MALKITSREYSNTYTTDKPSFLLANTGDWVHVKYAFTSIAQIVFNNSAIELNTSNSIQFQSSNTLIALDSSFWNLFGFAVGDSIVINYVEFKNGVVFTTNAIARTIVSINGSSLVYNGADIVPTYMTIMPQRTILDNGYGSTDEFEVKMVDIYTIKRPQSINFKYGLIKNSEFDSSNLGSFLDGTNLLMTATGLELLAPAGSKALTLVGNQSGYTILNPTIKYVTTTAGVDYFEIEFDLFINTFFDKKISALENLLIPSILEDTESITDNFSITLLPILGNPNVSISNNLQITKQLGSIGWVNENYNNVESLMTISDITYEDLFSNVRTELDYATATVVKGKINNVANLLTGTSAFGLGFIHLLKTESSFKNLTSPYIANFSVNTCGVQKKFLLVNNGGAKDATIYNGYGNDYVSISEIRFQKTNPLTTSVEFEFRVTPSAGFTTKFDAFSVANRGYALWVSSADRTLQTVSSDRVNLLVETNTFSKQPVVLGAYGYTIKYIHNFESKLVNNNFGATFHPQDNFAILSDFTIDTIDNILVQSIDYRIELINTITDERYLLDNVFCDVRNSLVLSNGVQVFDFSVKRGFLIDETTNDKNVATLSRYSTLDSGTEFGYRAYIPFKVRYEDWILNTNLPSDFVRNHFWYDLDANANYSIKLVIVTEIETGSYTDEYALTFRDYEDNPNITITERYYREIDNVLLTSAILRKGERVIYEVDFTRTSGTWIGVATTYVELQIEEELGGGWKTAHHISSAHKPLINSPLIPLTGQTYLKKTLISPTVMRMSCIIDGDRLPVGRYRLSPEIKGLIV